MRALKEWLGELFETLYSHHKKNWQNLQPCFRNYMKRSCANENSGVSSSSNEKKKTNLEQKCSTKLVEKCTEVEGRNRIEPYMLL